MCGGFEARHDGGHPLSCAEINAARARRIGHKIVGMKLRVAAVGAAIMLALPVCAQHGAARGGFSGHAGFAGHGGFAGHSGFAGHAGFAGHSGFPGARGISRSAPFSGHSAFGRPVFGRPGAPGLAAPRVPFRGTGFAPRRPQYRSQYRSPYGDRSGRRGRDRDRDRHRDHDRGRGRWLAGWYGNRYPFWLGYPYPYTIDPGLYDWGDSGDAGYAPDAGYSPNAAPAQNYADATPYPGDNTGPEPMQGSNEPQARATDARMPRPAYAGISTAAQETEPPITVIFKNGRAPLTIQNYLMNSRTLTDLDRQHYEQIALDQVDIAATQQTNRSRGFEFQVPAASAE